MISQSKSNYYAYVVFDLFFCLSISSSTFVYNLNCIIFMKLDLWVLKI